VLSGYVIAFTTENKNRGALQYAQARLSRLYSVLLPAILITFAIEAFIMFQYPVVHKVYYRDAMLLRYIASGLFINEIWFLSMAPPINGPLWSLSYEFWYYVVFGVFFFRKKFKYFAISLTIVLLVVGPKILLMMPIWLMGVMIYKLTKPRINDILAWFLVAGSWACAILISIYCPAMPQKLGTPPFFFGAQFITDWLIGISVACSIFFLPGWKNNGATAILKSKGGYFYFRKAADLTFPIYILHYPLLVLFKALVGVRIGSSSQLLTALVVVLLACGIIGFFLDKFRTNWTKFFGMILNRLKAQLGSI
jgi:peptidoglycan/LPS O-acetylase OafA/YrhL